MSQLASERDIITAKLDALRSELAEKFREEREAARAEAPAEMGSDSIGGDSVLGKYSVREGMPFETSEQQFARMQAIDTLHSQIALLKELKAQLDAQNSDTNAHFLAIEKRDMRSPRQGIWLTIVSSIITLILGWLLSLLGSPVAVLHALGR